MDESKVEKLVTRVIGSLEIFDLFLILSASGLSTRVQRTNLISQALPLRCLCLVPSHVIQLSE